MAKANLRNRPMRSDVKITLKVDEAEALLCLLYNTEETVLDDLYSALVWLGGLSTDAYTVRRAGYISPLTDITITKNKEGLL